MVWVNIPRCYFQEFDRCNFDMLEAIYAAAVSLALTWEDCLTLTCCRRFTREHLRRLNMTPQPHCCCRTVLSIDLGGTMPTSLLKLRAKACFFCCVWCVTDRVWLMFCTYQSIVHTEFSAVISLSVKSGSILCHYVSTVAQNVDSLGVLWWYHSWYSKDVRFSRTWHIRD